MKLNLTFAALAAAGTLAFVNAAQAGVVDSVNSYIGTGGGGTEYVGTMPFVEPPFAMTSWTPQTRQNRVSVTSCAYEDANISGFIGTHQPAI